MSKFERFQNLAREGALRAGVAIVTAVPALAMAQSTDPFTTAAADVQTKIGTYGAALVALSAVGVVFVVAIKYVKKIGGAS